MERPYFHKIQYDKMEKVLDDDDLEEKNTENSSQDFDHIHQEDVVPEEGQANPIKV